MRLLLTIIFLTTRPVKPSPNFTLTVVSPYGTPNPGTTNVVSGTTITNTIESVVNGAPGVRYKNIGSTVTND